MPDISSQVQKELRQNLSATLTEISNSKNPAEVESATKNIFEAAIKLITDPSEATASIYKSQLDLASLKIPGLNDSKNLAKVTKIFREILPEPQNQELREYLEIPLLERLNQKQQKEIVNEIKNTSDSIDKNNKKSKVKAVEDTLRDRKVAKQTEFVGNDKKPTGVSAGYITKETETGKTFILKQFYKTYDDCLKLRLQSEKEQALNDRRDGVQELIASTMYQFLLYDQAPKEGLVQPDENHSNSLYVRGKFFNNVVGLGTYSGSKEPTSIETENKNLKNLEGFEKVIAACHMLGEADYHAGNLMVQDGKTINKIDHGRSFIQYYNNFEDMINTTTENFDIMGYNDAINAGNFTFNIDKYSTALNQMVDQLSNNQIENIVDQKIAELKKAGFDPKGIEVLSIINDKETEILINNYDDLKNFYKEQLIQNRANMKEIAKCADIVSKFSDMSPEFKNGKWLQDFAKSKVKDPVLYAAQNNIKIEGKNALQWAYENDYKVRDTNIIQKETVSQELQWVKNAKNKWEQQKKQVKKNKKDFIFHDPMEYLKTTKDESKFSNDEKEFLNYTAKLDQQDQKISDKLSTLISTFSNQALKGKVTEKDVEAFYDKALETLKQEKYLNDEEIATIKNDKSYQQTIKSTTNFLNTVELNTKEKLCYKLANFCKKFSPNLSNHLINKGISPKNLDKLRSIDSAIAISVKLHNELIKPQSNEDILAKRRQNVHKKVQESIVQKPKREFAQR